MKAVMFGVQAIRLGDQDIVVAGGMESMSNTPYYATNGRWGSKYGNQPLVDGIVRDGLQDPYDGSMMGVSLLRSERSPLFLSLLPMH